MCFTFSMTNQRCRSVLFLLVMIHFTPSKFQGNDWLLVCGTDVAFVNENFFLQINLHDSKVINVLLVLCNNTKDSGRWKELF